MIMPTKVEKTIQVYRMIEEGQSELVSTHTIEVEEYTQEEIIAQKEEQLLAVYQELEQLKNNS
jgi:hypothetical protein